MNIAGESLKLNGGMRIVTHNRTMEEKIEKIIELDKKFFQQEIYKFKRTKDEIKGYESAFKFQLERLELLLRESK